MMPRPNTIVRDGILIDGLSSFVTVMFVSRTMFTNKKNDVIVRGLATLLSVLFMAGDSLAEKKVDYLKHIKPILAARCYTCHGALKQENGLRLDTVVQMKKGGDNGPGIVVGRNARSLIVQAITGSQGWRMPPEDEFDPLQTQQFELIKS